MAYLLTPARCDQGKRREEDYFCLHFSIYASCWLAGGSFKLKRDGLQLEK